MMQKLRIRLSLALVVLSAIQVLAGGYENFKVAVYCRAYEVQAMSDLQWLEATWEELSRQMANPINERSRGPWQGTGTSFDFDEMKKPMMLEDGTTFTPTKMSRAAGYSLQVVDKVLGHLGDPVGIKSYKPFHSVGEDYLQSFLGMIGIPVELEVTDRKASVNQYRAGKDVFVFELKIKAHSFRTFTL